MNRGSVIKQAREGLRQWLIKVMPGLNGVIDPDDEGVRPPVPYATMKFPLSRGRVGRDDKRDNGGGHFTMARQRVAVLELNVIGEECFDHMEAALSSLEMPATIAYLSSINVSNVGMTEVRDLSFIENTSSRKRAQVEISFYYSEEVTVDLQTVNEVVVTGPIAPVTDIKGD